MTNYNYVISQNQQTPPPVALRVIAGAVDLVVLFLSQFLGAYVTGVIVAVAMTLEGASEIVVYQHSSQAMFVGWVFWAGLMWVSNYIFLQGLTGATIGKKICQLQVVNENGSPIGVVKSLMRSLFYVVSFIPFLYGFFAIFWNQKSQAWHDLICKTVVLHQDENNKQSQNLEAVESLDKENSEDRDINRAA